MAKRPVPKKLTKKARQDPGQSRIESNRNGKGVELQGVTFASGANLAIRERQM